MIEDQAEEELSQAKPAMDAAQKAVDVLDANAITELKGFSKLPGGVDKVMAAVLMMAEGEMKSKNHTWDRAKKMMKDVGGFLRKLKSYSPEDMSEALIKGLTPIVEDPVMEFSVMVKEVLRRSQSEFLGRQLLQVQPHLRKGEAPDGLSAGSAEIKKNAEDTLAEVQALVASVEQKLKDLGDLFKKATDEKREVEENAEKCLARLGLAERLVNGLASEGKRWAMEIEELRKQESLLVGNVMLSAAFVSYIGAFNAQFRKRLWKDLWLEDINSKGIPISDAVDPISMLTDEAANATMYSEGLPADRISTENGSIINKCSRWPLMIDPQLQGIKWLRYREENREGSTMVAVQMSQSDWPRRIETAIQNGFVVIIENLGDDIDATLDPVLARAVYKKGRAYYIKFGGRARV